MRGQTMPTNIGRRTFVASSIKLAAAAQLIRLEPLQAAAQGPGRFPAAQSRALRGAIDVMIPAEGRMPAGSSVGVGGYVEGVAAVDSKLRTLLLDGFHAMEAHARAALGDGFSALNATQQAEVLAHFERAEPAGFFTALRDVVYEGYYTHPRVWKLLGYNFRKGRRRTARLEAFDERRLARVRAMAPFYRETPHE